jgi:phosphatidylglycerophosphate synthase
LVLDKIRSRSDFLVNGVASRLGSINPNSITILSLFIAILFAISFYYRFLVISFFLLLATSYLDVLDGAVARKFKKESMKGDFLDHLIDRYSDFIILLALTLSFFGNLYFGILAIAGTFMSSYVGTQSQAVGMKRIYGGFPGRADRLIIVLIVIVIQIFTSTTLIYGYYITSWALLFLGVAGFINSIYRAGLAYRSIA